MTFPHLFANKEKLDKIREDIKKYDWYEKSFLRIQKISDEMIEKGFFVPDKKGYVFNEACRAHNVNLVFDPYDKDSFVCPVCRVNFKDEPYRRAWINIYHSWLSQMIIYLGISYQMTFDDKYADAGRKIILGYVEKYPNYPNRDNEIGTTKLSQSTFVESIWLTHLCCGYDLLNQSSVFSDQDRKEALDLFIQSAKTIYDYDERWNNRQAFNNSGMCAAAILNGDRKLLDYVLNGPHGFVKHMENSLLEDGLWYEGDNYHFATLPSIVNIAQMCLFNGIDLYNRSFNGKSIKDMFYGPLLSLQPDGTFPSRKDSPYANSASNRWYAGLYEIAYSRYQDKELSDFLNFIYKTPPVDAKKITSAAGIMDVLAPGISSLESMDWRGFLSVDPERSSDMGLPVTDSVNMKGTGLAVLRRDDSYASVDYGHYGGGHGHPDRLAVTCFLKGKRWFSDYGTGNYYLDHLRYYRSSLGHNTVVQDGKRQAVVSGEYEFFYKGQAFDATRAYVKDIYPKTDGRRTLALFEDSLLFDFVEIESNTKHTYHQVFHSFGKLNDDDYGDSLLEIDEEGYDFLRNVKSKKVEANRINIFTDKNASLYMYSSSKAPFVQHSAMAYGPPKEIPKLFPKLIMEKRDKLVVFANLYEHVDKDNKRKVKSLDYIDDYNYKITFYNKEDIYIDLSQGIEVKYFKDGKLVVESQKVEVQEEINLGVEYQTWIDYNTGSDKQFCVEVTNRDSNHIYAEIMGRDILLSPKESKIFRYSTNHRNIQIDKGYLKAYYSETEKPFEKKIIDVFKYDGFGPINEVSLKENIVIDQESQIARAERRWEGKSDISAKGSIFMPNEDSIALVLKVEDDTVMFDGGKYNYDNDSIEVFFDRRDELYRNAKDLNPQTYAMLLKGGSSGNVSKVVPISKNIEDITAISLTMNQRENGYDVAMVLPFDCIGGKPEKNDIWGFDIIVSDRDSGVRREFMAYLSPALEGERVYMRGEDSHSPQRFVLLRF